MTTLYGFAGMQSSTYAAPGGVVNALYNYYNPAIGGYMSQMPQSPVYATFNNYSYGMGSPPNYGPNSYMGTLPSNPHAPPYANGGAAYQQWYAASMQQQQARRQEYLASIPPDVSPYTSMGSNRLMAGNPWMVIAQENLAGGYEAYAQYRDDNQQNAQVIMTVNSVSNPLLALMLDLYELNNGQDAVTGQRLTTLERNLIIFSMAAGPIADALGEVAQGATRMFRALRPAARQMDEVMQHAPDVAQATARTADGVAGRMPNVPWQYGPPGDYMGYTDVYGNIFINPRLIGRDLVETVRHESMHRYFTPRGSELALARAKMGRYVYHHTSHLVRYLEEAIAETYATQSLSQGLAFPFHPHYRLSRLRVASEAVAYIVTVGGAWTATYYYAGGQSPVNGSP